MAGLPSDPCVIFYNGVTFPPETQTTDYSAKGVPDASGRTYKYVTYSITVKTTLGRVNQGTGATTDDTLADLRVRLNAPGGEFHYRGVGAGPLSVNVPPAGPSVSGGSSAVRDVVWGPKPQILRWSPKGQYAAEVTWAVEVNVPECSGAVYADAIMEHAFKINTVGDRGGYTKRTITGFLRIPQTRATVSSKTLTDQADRYLERVVPPLLPGFHRTPPNTTLSEDKCRLDYTVLDEEVGPNYPPKGVVQVSANCLVNTNDLAGIKWSMVISATYEVARDVPRGDAFAAFNALVEDRLADARAGFTQVKKGGKISKITPLQMAETYAEPEIYGRRGAAFSATFKIMCSREDIVKASGLWKPVPGNDWAQWSASLANTAFNARGNAKLKADNSVDVIVDLCAAPGGYGLKAGVLPSPGPRAGVLDSAVTAIDPDISWLDYECQVVAEADDEVYSLKPLPPAGYTVAAGATPTTEAPNPLDPFPPLGGAKLDHVDVSAPDTVAQKRATQTRYVYLRGSAHRAGYPVDEPELVAAVGGTVVRACRADRGEGITHEIVDVWFGVPIHFATWNLRYLVTGPIRDLEIPAHPYA